MSKEIPKSTFENDSQNSKRSETISTVSGILFVSFVVGYTVAKNQSLRDEISKQIQNVLRVSKDLVQQVRFITDRIHRINVLLKAEISTDDKEALVAINKSEESKTEYKNRTNVREDIKSENDIEMRKLLLRVKQDEYDSFWSFLNE
ncbi:MAG: hypothetical protein FWH40_01400 [Coriobacteriia bacterium]|nr:hypothetical protein [Coriobacteriia bacterium]